MSVWDLSELAKRRRGQPDARFATPARPPGPARGRRIAAELIAGNGGVRATAATGRYWATGRLSLKADPQSCPEPMTTGGQHRV